MPSVMTLDGAHGLAGNPIGDWILGRGLLLGGIVLPLALSLAVGTVVGGGGVWAINRFKKAAGRPALSGARVLRRRRALRPHKRRR